MVVVALLCGITSADAQYLRERGLVREGNRNFSKQNYRTSLCGSSASRSYGYPHAPNRARGDTVHRHL